ncbi:MAG: hypothetical protein KAT18_08805 [Candidatus Latescibacteria bacterium]|nr:hypothetical protein [Candidatus Latescibacterota bacterium]
MIRSGSWLLTGFFLLVITPGQVIASAPSGATDCGRAIGAQYDTIAVMPFQNATNDQSLDWLSMGIPETIMADLSAVGGIVLIERIQLWRVMDEQALQLTGAVSDASAMEIGRLVGASLLVVGAFQRQGSMMRLTARFVEAESGSVMQTAKVTGRLNDIFDLQDKLVSELATGMNLSTASTKSARLVPELTKSIEAFQHFGQAALYQAQKNYQGVVEELRRAVALDPGFTLARDRLTDAFLMLDEDNYWEYETVVSSSGKAESRSIDLHRAGGVSGLKGKQCYTYIRKVVGTSQGDEFVGRIVEYYEKREDGIYLAGELVDPERGSETLRIYNPSVLVFPYEMEVGRKWSSEHRVKERRPSGSGNVRYQQATILRKENVEIPSVGTLECYVIQYDQRVSSAASPATVWFAPGIGVVKVVWQEMGDKVSGSSRRIEMVLRNFHFEG